MKLTVQVKLLPSPEQADALIDTLRTSNAAANQISQIAWKHRSFGHYKVHRLAYHRVKCSSGLSSQMVIRAIAKVADAYKIDNKRMRTFKPLGAIAYDGRILRWKDDELSIWTVAGRQRIPFVCGERTAQMLKSRQGESDLVYRGGNWFLLGHGSCRGAAARHAGGVDRRRPWRRQYRYGLRRRNAQSEKTEKSRRRYERIRSKLQAAGTKSAKRHLKKLARRERRMKRDANHVISKRLVSKAAETNRGICLEDLKDIRKRTTVRRTQRSRHGKWAFGELRSFVEYKARLAGIAFALVDPRYSSQTCSGCGHCEKANRRTRSEFVCKSCGYVALADENAAVNIRRRALVNELS